MQDVTDGGASTGGTAGGVVHPSPAPPESSEGACSAKTKMGRLAAGVLYEVRFSAADDANTDDTYQELEVKLDGKKVRCTVMVAQHLCVVD